MFSNSIKIFLVAIGIIIGVNSETTILEQTNSKEIEQADKLLFFLESNIHYYFPFDDVFNGPPDNFFPTRLHNIVSDSLMIVDTLNYKPNKGIVGWVEWIKHYPGEKLIFMLERLEHLAYHRITSINYNNGIDINHFYFLRSQEYALTYWIKLLKSHKTGRVLNNFFFVIEEDNSRHIFKDHEFNLIEELNFEEYYFIEEGVAGTVLNQRRTIKAPISIKNSNCDVHIYYERIGKPPYMFSFPCDLDDTKEEIFFRLINDEYIILRSSTDLGFFEPFDDTTSLVANHKIYDYHYGLIDSFSIDGGMGTGLSYLHNDWIYGSVGYRRPPRSDRNPYHPDTYSPSPGDRVYDYNIFSMDSRYFDYGKYGIPFEWREYDQRLYLPGELYSLHLPTMKQTYWETGQGDSEILLLNDEEVIYREHHKIFRAPIVDYQPMIEERELLVMDSLIVPHIHWAFYAEEGSINKTVRNKEGFYEYMEGR